MPRPATGQVVERQTQRGRVFALRFRAYGQRQYVTLGSADEGWSRARAEFELQNVLADVRRGICQPPTRAGAVVEDADAEPTFHEFASDWMHAQRLQGGRNGTGLSAKGATDLEWRIVNHLLPFFAQLR